MGEAKTSAIFAPFSTALKTSLRTYGQLASDFNKDFSLKDQDQDKDLQCKDQDKDQDF